MTLVINKVEPKKAGDRVEKARVTPRLYRAREPIHPKLAHGRYRTIKWAVLLVTLGVYYVTPWIRWARPGGLPDQMVLIDFDHGRFYLGPVQFWAQEIYYVIGLLILSALGLFLATSLFGRLWCGFTCPQTVWTDLFIAVERLFEGDRNARLRLDKAPWSFDKAWRKLGKHAVWLMVAAATGGAWVFYFRDAPTLWSELWRGAAPTTTYVWVGLLTFTTYWLAGWMREQVCTFMCPWPRIQGAMLDAHSLQVTYRYDRGEPRGPHKKNTSWEGRGDCVDCLQCVVVCPVGIDIRNGPQLECINCTLCIDACNEVMTKVGRPRGLIGFDTDDAVAARAAGRKPVYRLVRGRTVYYALALTLVGSLILYGLLTRQTAGLEVLHDRNPTFVRLKDGSIRNAYTLKIANRGVEPTTYEIVFKGPAGAKLHTVGLGDDADGRIHVDVAPSEVRTLRVFVRAPEGSAPTERQAAVFDLTDLKAGERHPVHTVFLAEGARP